MEENYHVLKNMKKDWYQKGADEINIHLYVRDVEEHKIIFENGRVIVKFSTRHISFLKQHVKGRNKTSFCYVINTRCDIDGSGCHYKVKPPFIELILKKKTPADWRSLERFVIDDLSTSQTTSTKRKTKKENQQDSPPVKSQLLGGKSTPLTKKISEEDGGTKVDNQQATSSNAGDQRNIKKSTPSTIQLEMIGLTGLENYANNCYMNVVIQILANIQETRDFFKCDHFLKDINANNPLGSGGKVAKAFAEVTKALWSVRRNAFKPAALKSIMGRRCSLFLGWQQHDAQEFFSSLLDNLHEDLNQYVSENTVTDKEKEASKQDGETCSNEKPDTAWSAHLKRNNSFVTKLFHGQLMSKLTCAACHKVSYSFDPCAQVSLPIPSCKSVLNILFFTRDNETQPLLIDLPISTPNAQVWHVINMLQVITKVPSQCIKLMDGYTDICLDDRAPMQCLQKEKYIIASEVAYKDENDVISLPVFQYLLYVSSCVKCDGCGRLEAEFENKLKRCTRCMVVAYCSRDCQSKHWNIHGKHCSKDLKMQVGLPFYATFRKELLTYSKMESDLKERASFSLEFPSNQSTEERPNGETTNTKPNEYSENMRMKSNSGCVIKLCYKVNVNDEACVELNDDSFSVEAILKACSLILEWQNSPSSTDDVSSSCIQSKTTPSYEILDHETNTTSTNEHCMSLYDSLRLFMEPERLDESESWKCPKCKSLEAAKKEMAISSPPCLLLLHFKRFSYREYGQKINKAVSYPISGFDLTPFIAKETRSKFDYPLVYDLCGVITHRGTMRMGHYTCMVRLINEQDEEEIGWRHFDDDYVIKIKNEKVISPDAYVLVYRLRGTQEILKLDKHPILTHASPTASTENIGHTKRKRADSVAGKSPNSERRSVSDYSLNRMKRSTSIESDDTIKKQIDGNSGGMGMRRCASAVPVETNTSSGLNVLKSGSLPDVSQTSCDSSLLASSSEEYINTNLAFDSEISSFPGLCGSFEELSVEEEWKNLDDVIVPDTPQCFDDDTFMNIADNAPSQTGCSSLDEDDLD